MMWRIRNNLLLQLQHHPLHRNPKRNHRVGEDIGRSNRIITEWIIPMIVHNLDSVQNKLPNKRQNTMIGWKRVWCHGLIKLLEVVLKVEDHSAFNRHSKM